MFFLHTNLFSVSWWVIYVNFILLEEACVILFKADHMEDGEAGGNKQEVWCYVILYIAYIYLLVNYVCQLIYLIVWLVVENGAEITGNILQWSNGTTVVEGKWNSREVAIKQVPKKKDNESHTKREMVTP
jgi:hypothetical protein